MSFGSFAIGSVTLGGSMGPPLVACPTTPSCNLIVMEILQRLRDTGICIVYPNSDIYVNK